MKLKSSNCDKTQKLKLWQNSITQIVTKLELRQISFYEGQQLLKGSLVQTFSHLGNQWDVLWAVFCNVWEFSDLGGSEILVKLKSKPLSLKGVQVKTTYSLSTELKGLTEYFWILKMTEEKPIFFVSKIN